MDDPVLPPPPRPFPRALQSRRLLYRASLVTTGSLAIILGVHSVRVLSVRWQSPNEVSLFDTGLAAVLLVGVLLSPLLVRFLWRRYLIMMRALTRGIPCWAEVRHRGVPDYGHTEYLRVGYRHEGVEHEQAVELTPLQHPVYNLGHEVLLLLDPAAPEHPVLLTDQIATEWGVTGTGSS